MGAGETRTNPETPDDATITGLSLHRLLSIDPLQRLLHRIIASADEVFGYWINTDVRLHSVTVKESPAGLIGHHRSDPDADACASESK